MATLTHAQYNSPMPLYSRDNVQEVLNQVTGSPYPARPHSAMSTGSFDPSQSHVYRYLQTGGQIPNAHSARYDDQAGIDHPRYRGFVDPNVQSPSFKRLQYVTGVDSGAEDEISHELQPPPKTHTELHTSNRSHLTTTSQQQSGGGAQPIALGYAPIGGSGGQQQQSQQGYQQQYGSDQHYQQQQHHEESSTRTHFADDSVGPPVAQRDPTSDDADRDHPLDPTFAARIAEAERPKVPPTVLPSWTRYAERKHDRWEQQGGGHSESYQQPAPTAQHYRPPQPGQHQNPSYTLDSSRAAQDKWQAHYAPYRFETGATPAPGAQDRPRSRSVEPAYVSGRHYGGYKEWMKPFVAPNLRYNYGENYAQPQQSYNFSLGLGGGDGRTSSTTTTTHQGYGTGQYGGGQTGAGGYGSQNYSSLSSNQQFGTSTGGFGGTGGGTGGYAPQSQTQGGIGGTRSPSAYDYTSTSTTQGGAGGQLYGGTIGGSTAPAIQSGGGPGGRSSQSSSQFSRTLYESRTGGTTGSQPQRQPQPAIAAPWTGGGSQSTTQSYRTDTQSQALWQNENEARRQRQKMEQEVMRRAASAGPATGRQGTTTTTTVNTGPSQDNRVTTYSSGPAVGARWQQAPGSETKSQSSGSYKDPQGNVVNYTKEVYTSSDPGKEFSMLTEQEKKILEEPLQPGVISRHITTKYYKKSTFTSSTTTSSTQTPPVTSSVSRQAITSGSGRQF